MARGRNIPTKLFKDPAFFELGDAAKLVLIGLILDADDYGRGLAHPALLARELDRTISEIEETLPVLQHKKLLICYQGEDYRYYALTRWQEWETLSKPTPSRYPAPPTGSLSPASVSESTVSASEFQTIDASSDSPVPNGPGEKEPVIEQQESKGEDLADNGADLPPASVDPNASTAISHAQKTLLERTREVATILRLPVDAALKRVVEEYLSDPSLSLLGEADAAREWISDKRRNQKGVLMSPAFFRRWLKREQEMRQARAGQAEPPAGTVGSRQGGGQAAAPPSSQKDEQTAHIEAFVKRRQQEVLEELRRSREAEAAAAEGSSVCSN